MYTRAMTPDEVYLAHYGVPGMKWGVRKLRKLNHKNASDMRKVARIKARMGRHLSRRKTTSKLLSSASRSDLRGEKFKAGALRKVANAIDPMHAVRSMRIKHINKRLKKRLAEVSNLSPIVAEAYRKRGEEVYQKAMDKKYNILAKKMKIGG